MLSFLTIGIGASSQGFVTKSYGETSMGQCIDRPVATEKIVKIVSRHLGVPAEEIQLESNLVNDLGADSLDAVEIIIECEEEFEIKVPDEVAENFQTIEDAVNFVCG